MLTGEVPSLLMMAPATEKGSMLKGTGFTSYWCSGRQMLVRGIEYPLIVSPGAYVDAALCLTACISSALASGGTPDMALVKMAGGVDVSGLELPVADFREISALTASCSCTAGLEKETREKIDKLPATS